MNKLISIAFVLFLFVFVCSVSTASAKNVDIVVAGYIGHGPMQPTVQAIKDMASKYGDKVRITWIDLETEEGQSYFQEHGLTAHLNVIINGKYEYKINGKDVTFQWFEGHQWKKEDLDALISSLLNNESNVTLVNQTKAEQRSFNLVVIFIILGVASIGAWLIIKKVVSR